MCVRDTNAFYYLNTLRNSTFNSSSCSFLLRRSWRYSSRAFRLSSWSEKRICPLRSISSSTRETVSWNTFFFNRHSQTMMTDQPLASSWRQTFWSRSWLRVILAVQNSGLVLGTENNRQSLWPCQKQPWTKMTVRYLGASIQADPLLLRVHRIIGRKSCMNTTAWTAKPPRKPANTVFRQALLMRRK